MKGSKFMAYVREVIRTNHFSYSTEKTYINWIYRFIIFHNKRHPEDMCGNEIAEFLTYLAVDRKVSASTQNQALNALVFLYKKVLKIPLDAFDFKQAKIGKRLPVVFSRDEVQDVLSNLHGEFHLMASLLYGSGLRLTECMKLRIKILTLISMN
jgi:integrase